MGRSGAARTHLLVAWVGSVTAGVADRGGVHPRGAPEDPLSAPETAHPEYRRAQRVRERWHDAVAGHGGTLPNRHRDGSPGKRLLGGHHAGFVASEEGHATRLRRHQITPRLPARL